MPDVTASSIECGFGFLLYHGGLQRRGTTFLGCTDGVVDIDVD
jgi:hypothetical protein